MEEADDRGGPGILTDCLAGLADTTIWADKGPIEQNPSKIEPQDKKDASHGNANYCLENPNNLVFGFQVF